VAVITVLGRRGPIKSSGTPENGVYRSSDVTTAEWYCSVQIFKDITYGIASTIIDR